MPKPVLLTCHFSAKRLSRVRVIAMRLGFRVRAVEKWEYLQPIGSFTGDCGSFESFYDGEDFPEELLIMAHFPQSLFSRFLQELRAAQLVVPLKCVLTESNRGWNMLELHRELCAERDALTQERSAHPQPQE